MTTERKLNDPLRELLEFVKQQIDRSPDETRALEGITELMAPLDNAIQDLERNPGPTQPITG